MALLILGSIAREARAAAAPELTRVQSTSQGVTLGWTDPDGASVFVVQARDALGTGLWLDATASFRWPLRGTEWTDATVTAGASSRFYRVRAVEPAVRGRLLEATSSGPLSLPEIRFLLQLQQVALEPKYPVTVYKLVYETISPLGARARASGALVVPRDVTGPLPLVSYQHGTLAKKTEAPSSTPVGEVLIGVVLASSGYVAMLPDYLGLGDSPGIHPYHHAASEATAAVDMLRAARQYCQDSGVALNGQLFLCGYSQGGHGTMALLRELEQFHADEFPVTAAAPMAGAYDLSGVTADGFLTEEPVPNPYYFALLLAAYQEVYGIAGSLAELLVAPYDQTLPPLLTGQATGSQINGAMPRVPTRILRPEVLAAFRGDPHHPLRLALRENDLHRWLPRTPMRLYHCRGDQDVRFANSEVALASFRAAGATQVELIDPLPSASHGECAQPTLLLAKNWFDSLRKP
jgi:hypothetical protein